MHRTASNKSTRWLSKGAPGMKSRRGGFDEASLDQNGDPHEHDNVKVNGIPDWENPMAQTASGDSSTVVTHSPPKGTSSSVRSPTKRGVERSRSGDSRVLSTRSFAGSHSNGLNHSHSTLNHSPVKAVPVGRAPPSVRGVERARSSEIKMPCVPKNVYNPDEDEDANRPNFENMVIECDHSNSSNGELTVDESVLFDDDYGRRAYQQRHGASRAGSGGGGGPVRNPRRPQPLGAGVNRHSQSSSPHVIPDDQNQGGGSSSRRGAATTTAEPLSPARSLEDEEQRLIELAMERSLQESQSGSAMSISRKSGTSDFSHQSRPSPNVRRSNSSSSATVNLGGAGCHLSMISSRPRSGSGSQTPSHGGPPGDAGPNFMWKREGKKWLKVPVDHKNHTDGLQAIEEEMNESMHHSSHRGFSGNEEDRLEQMERRMIEEAMKLSMKNHGHMSRQSLQDSFANSTNDILEMSEDDGASQGSAADIDAEAALNRLRELEQEKAMLEKAVRRRAQSADGGTSRETRRNSLTNGNYATDSRRSFDRSVSDMSGAGCHLSMVSGSRSRRSVSDSGSKYEYQSGAPGATRITIGIGSNGGGSDEQPSSNAGTDSQGRKLVWKRGPNNAWGRFPEDDAEDEDRLVAEALKRSLEEM